MLYRVGQAVKLRTYKSLANEYGLNRGLIQRGFSQRMMENCGRKAVITSCRFRSLVELQFDAGACADSYPIETIEPHENSS